MNFLLKASGSSKGCAAVCAAMLVITVWSIAGPPASLTLAWIAAAAGTGLGLGYLTGRFVLKLTGGFALILGSVFLLFVGLAVAIWVGVVFSDKLALGPMQILMYVISVFATSFCASRKIASNDNDRELGIFLFPLIMSGITITMLALIQTVPHLASLSN